MLPWYALQVGCLLQWVWKAEYQVRALRSNGICLTRFWIYLRLVTHFFFWNGNICPMPVGMGTSVPGLFHHYILETHNLFDFIDLQLENLRMNCTLLLFSP